MKIHELQLTPNQYTPLAQGKKHALTLRPLAGAGYELHDLLVLREYDDEVEELTGRHRVARITWVDRGGAGEDALLQPEVRVLSLRIFREPRSI